MKIIVGATALALLASCGVPVDEPRCRDRIWLDGEWKYTAAVCPQGTDDGSFIGGPVADPGPDDPGPDDPGTDDPGTDEGKSNASENNGKGGNDGNGGKSRDGSKNPK